MLLEFTKMHGLGNDFLVLDLISQRAYLDALTIQRLADRHFGIGFDQLLIVEPPDFPNADFKYRIFNADGSEAMMCGNGSRCVGKYVYEYGLTDKTEITLDTLSGIKILKLQVEGKTVSTVTVDMGSPQETGEIDWKKKYPFPSTKVSMGNPHLVTFVEDITQINLPEIGPELENHPLFPDRTNVEFAQIVSKDTIRMRVWERGSGITQACGTGACATAVAAFINGLAGRKSDVIMDGGTVTIEWDETSGHILMTGPATKVFDGEIEDK